MIIIAPGAPLASGADIRLAGPGDAEWRLLHVTDTHLALAPPSALAARMPAAFALHL